MADLIEVRLGDETEHRFVEWATSLGWSVTKRGWPDFICRREGDVMVVEVKGGRAPGFTANQITTLGMLAAYGVPTFVYRRDHLQEFKSKRPASMSTRLRDAVSVRDAVSARDAALRERTIARNEAARAKREVRLLRRLMQKSGDHVSGRAHIYWYFDDGDGRYHGAFDADTGTPGEPWEPRSIHRKTMGWLTIRLPKPTWSTPPPAAQCHSCVRNVPLARERLYRTTPVTSEALAGHIGVSPSYAASYLRRLRMNATYGSAVTNGPDTPSPEPATIGP